MDQKLENDSVSNVEWCEGILQVTKAFISKYAELVSKEIDEDLEKINDLDAIDMNYLAAYWWNAVRVISGSDGPKRLSSLPNDAESLEYKYKFICDSFDFYPIDEAVKNDVKNRLEWIKKKVSKDFESTISRIIGTHKITSPIEQIFLMEWKYLKVEERFGVELSPSSKVETDIGIFILDFQITSESNPNFKLAIELDGHDFHEKTKEQVARDKRRERAIVKKKIPVLRFSGSEIFRKARSCIEEIIQYIEENADCG